MKKYIYEKQEMDKQLESLITPFIKEKNCNIIGYFYFFFLAGFYTKYVWNIFWS